MLLVVWTTGCSRASEGEFDYLETNTIVFNQVHDLLFRGMYSFPIEKGQLLVYDTLTFSERNMDLESLKTSFSNLEAEWPEGSTLSLLDNFSLNKRVLKLRKIMSDYRIEANPKIANDLIDSDPENYFGRIRVSNFAYSFNRKEVLFYMAIHCGNDCSKGIIVHCEIDENGTWDIVKTAESWYG